MLFQEEYDFVIVGGGTAGLVLANRLSENKSTSVLALEAGTNRIDDARVTIPGMSSALYNSEFDWMFKSVPQVCSGNTTVINSQKLIGNR